MMAVDLRETEWSNKEDFMIWLQSEGVSAATICTLEGKICSYIHAGFFKNLLLTDNEVDSVKSLKQLTDDDIREAIKPIGARRKIVTLRDRLNNVNP